jgi:hypothetical protein
MAKIATITAAIMKAINTIVPNGSSGISPLEIASKQHKLIYAAYIGAGFLLALMTWLFARSSDRIQDIVRRDADARIEEAKATGSKANERAEKLENANLTLKGQVAGLEIAASDAKAGQQRVETDLEKQKEVTARAEKDVAGLKRLAGEQQERAAKAEKELLELKERIKPRHLSNEQKAALIELLKHNPSGDVSISCLNGDKEACDFASEITSALTAGGWKVDGPHDMVVFSASGGPPSVLLCRLQRWIKTNLR